MNNNFINRKDRIIASAVEIISEAGLASLTTKTLAMKENMSESLLYRYFGGIEEVLVEVVDAYTKFDSSIIATIEAKNISHLDKVLELMKTYSTYYTGYFEMSAIVLNSEGLLHDVNTRDAITKCISVRAGFVYEQFTAAIEEGEIVDTFSPEELTRIFIGSAISDLLNRRIQNDNRSHTQVIMHTAEKLADMIRKK